MTTGPLLDPSILDAFNRDGAVKLPGAFTDWVGTLQAGVAENMANPNPNVRLYESEDGGGRFFSDYCSWQRIPEYRDFIFNSPAAQIGACLMGSELVQLFHEHVLVKEASSSVRTPWHQDAPYYSVIADRTVSLWIPLDPVPRDRTLEFIAGSHLWGKDFQPQRFNGEALNGNDGLEGVPDIDAARDRYAILGWAVEPGDAIAFDFRTVHGAPGNTSRTEMRRAFSLRLVGNGARFRRKEGLVTSPPFPDVTLADGDALAGSEFPVLLG